jgi:hypothetical protein
MALNANPTSFTATRNGRGFYAYSAGQTGGAGDITLIDIANVGLDDLLATVTCSADWSQVAASLGFSINIDGVAVAYNVAEPDAGGPGHNGVVAPMVFKIIIPGQAAFAVVSSHDGSSGGALRSAAVVAFPLLVPGG